MKNSVENIIYQDEETKINFEYVSNYNNEYLTFILSIVTEKFTAKQEFYLNIDYVNEILMQLNKMCDTNNGNVFINDSNSESYIKCLMNGYKNVRIQGYVGDIFESIHMNFDIEVDQTTISLLENKLRLTIKSQEKNQNFSKKF